MAKGKYHEWLKPEGLIRIKGWAMDGLTDKQIADNIGISKQTFYDWVKRFPDFADSIKVSKDVADREVEQALYNKALGRCKVTETIKELRFNPATKKLELMVVKETIKGVPPDVAAQVFWLKNRKQDNWRDKRVYDAVPSNNNFDNVAEVTAEILQASQDRKLDDFLTEDGDQNE
ncbi:MAG: helix-turn-helix domain-containing protein [Clostridiales bacterium]|nr:helix-turn-helix domain-containing protein [Clostridiales bacterium]